jgi:hypothetical protein
LVYQYHPDTNGLTLLRSGSFGGNYTVTWDDNNTILYAGLKYIIYTNATGANTCYVNGVNGGHNASISMGGLTVQWTFRSAHLPPQITQTNGVYGQLEGIFFDLSNATAPVPVTAERMWYRGDYGTTDYGLEGNNIGDTVGTPALTASNAKLYNVSYQTAATSCFYNSSATTVTGNVNESVCYWLYDTNGVVSGDFIALSLSPFTTSHQGNSFGFENGDLVLFNFFNNIGYTYSTPTNAWMHICTVYHADTEMADFYFNSTYLGSAASTGTPNFAGGKVILGGWDNGGTCTNSGFIGQIQDVRVYDISLNQSQVDFIYNGGAGTDQPLNYAPPLPPPPSPFPLNGTDPRTIRPSNLVHYWGMNQSGTQNVVDEGLVPIPLQNTNGTFQTEYTDAYMLITNATFLRNLTDPGTRNFTTDGYYGSVNWTMSLRLRLDRLKDGSDGNTEQHVTFAEDDGGAYLMYQNAYCLGDTYDAILFGSNTSSYTGACYGDAGFNDTHVYLGESPAVGEWRTVTVTHDDTGLFKVYINGVLNHTQQEAANSMLQPQYSTDLLYGVELSGYSENDPVWQLNGGLQRVAFWNAALNASEVWSLGQSGPYVPPPVVRDPILLEHNASFNAVTWGSNGGTKQALAARLVFTSYHNVTSFSIKRGATNSPEGMYNITLETDNSEAPSNTPACAGSYKEFTAAELNTGPVGQEYFAYLNSQCGVSPGVYWLVWDSNETGTHNVEADIDPGASVSPPYPVQYRQNDGSWMTGYNNHIMNYFLYGINVSAPVPPLVPTKELAWYTGDAGYDDSSNHGYYLDSTSGSVAFVGGKVGNAFNFATGRAYTNSTYQFMTGNQAHSYCYWLNSTSLPSSGNNMYHLGIGVNSGTDASSVGFSNPGSGTVYQARTPSSGNNTYDITWTTGEWHHVCDVYDPGTYKMDLYYDGVKHAAALDLTSAVSFTSGSAIQLGWDISGGGGVDGLMDDVRFYNFSLNASEVAFLYQGGAGTNLSLSNYTPYVPPPVVCNAAVANATETSWYDADWGYCDAGTAGNNLEDIGEIFQACGPGTPTGSCAFQAAPGTSTNETMLRNATVSGLSTGNHDMTVCAWAREGSYQPAGGRMFVSSYFTPACFDDFWLVDNGGTVELRTDCEGSGGIAPVFETYVHYCAAYDAATQTVGLYVNGTLYTNTTLANMPTFSTPFITLFNSPDQQNPMSGYLDDVRIYNNKVLSAGEVGFLYNNGLGTNHSVSEYVPPSMPLEYVNDSFETSVTGYDVAKYNWSAAGTVIIETGIVHSGNQSLRVPRGGTNSYIYTQQNMTANETCSVYAYQTTLPTSGNYVRAGMFTQLDANVFLGSVGAANDTNWVAGQYSGTWQVTTKPILLNTWQRFAVHHVGNGTVEYYIDGDKVFSLGGQQNSLEAFWLGLQGGSGDSGYMYLDDAKCWPGGLTDEPGYVPPVPPVVPSRNVTNISVSITYPSEGASVVRAAVVNFTVTDPDSDLLKCALVVNGSSQGYSSVALRGAPGSTLYGQTMNLSAFAGQSLAASVRCTDGVDSHDVISENLTNVTEVGCVDGINQQSGGCVQNYCEMVPSHYTETIQVMNLSGVRYVDKVGVWIRNSGIYNPTGMKVSTSMDCVNYVEQPTGPLYGAYIPGDPVPQRNYVNLSSVVPAACVKVNVSKNNCGANNDAFLIIGEVQVFGSVFNDSLYADSGVMNFSVFAPASIVNVSCETTYPYVGDVPMAKMPVNFTVVDGSMVGQSSSAVLGGTKNGVCSETLGVGSARYDCLVNISISDSVGAYGLNVSYQDDDDYASDSATSCSIGGVLASVRVGDAVTFAGAGPGLNNVSGDQPIVLRNVGNLPLGIHMTGFNLVGRSQPGVTLPASAFRTGASLPTSVQMAHGVQKNLSMSLPVGQNASVLFWLSMPSSQLVQDYYAATPWQIVGSG